MKEHILVNVTSQETRVAIIEEGIVQELQIERSDAKGLVGNIYLGQVKRVLPGMQSAFIEIGLARTAFLHIADMLEFRQTPPPVAPIEQILHDGQPIIVQVIKDAIGSKGARLTTHLSLAGRYLVYLPQEKHIGISQRIEGETEREHLRQRLLHLLGSEPDDGFILRTSAEEASDAAIQQDIEYLRKLWGNLQTRAGQLPQQSLLFEELSLPLRVLRDVAQPDTESILVDCAETASAMQTFASTYINPIAHKIKAHAGERPLFEYYNVESEIERALAKRVNLKFGSYLIIDQTEAMTTIDVNTGAFVGTRSFEDTIFKTNLEAAHVIARQLRLRNLGGMIIIDFIDMAQTLHQEAVLLELEKTLAKDRTQASISGFSSLGLVEITRKRTRESLAHLLCEACPTCAGRGQIKTAQTICYEILREILREARQFNAREYRILASQTVVDLFLDEESQHLAQLADQISKPISLQVETSYTQEQFDVILL